MTNSHLAKFLRADNGVAAIETALIMPFMFMLYFGMIDITALISFNRKITYTASVMADLTAQSGTSILKSTVTDYFNAADLIMSPTPSSNFKVAVEGYRSVSGTPTKIWSTSTGGSSCATSVSTASMTPLMTAGNDLVVASVCMTYTPYVATFLGEAVLGKTSFNIQQTMMVRPRTTATLNCYQTTVAAGTLCT